MHDRQAARTISVAPASTGTARRRGTARRGDTAPGRITGLLAALAALTLGPLAAALTWHAAQRFDARLWEPGDAVAIAVGAAGALLAARFLVDVALAVPAELRGRPSSAAGPVARAAAAAIAALVLGAGAAHAAEAPPSAGWLPAGAADVQLWMPAQETPSPARIVTAPTGTTRAEKEPSTDTSDAPGNRASAPRIVTAGESLWSITADALGPDASEAQIAARWPELYAANREAIGPDPDLIQPGLRLALPDALAEDVR